MCGHFKYPPCGSGPSHSDTLYDRFSGRVAYTYGSEIDAPLSVIRIGYGQDSILFGRFAVIPLTDWRGAYAYAFAANSGTRRQIQGMRWIDEDTPSDTLDLGELGWPALNRSAYHHRTQGSPTYWFGNLLDGQRDASGLQYMRNRYYDPVSGRFTQEDPIGLAGGLNLYGFANGDPVSFSDPFGLCGKKGEEPCHVYTLTIGFAGAYFVGGNANLGMAFSSEGFRLFANTGASFGMGASVAKIQGSREEGTLENYGDKLSQAAFSGAGSPSVATPWISASQIRSQATDKDGQPTTQATGKAVGAGPGAGVFFNYTDGQVSSDVVPWVSASTPMSFTCAKTGTGCSTTTSTIPATGTTPR